MMNSLWIAKTGMNAQQTNMDTVSHNLANVTTTGFKRQTAVFEDLIYQNLRQVGSQVDEQNQLPTGMHMGLGVRSVATTRTFSQGTPLETGKAYDVAVNGDGTLVTSGGYPLLDGITVPPDSRSFTISKTGIVTVLAPGETEPQQIGQLNLATFINPAGLEPVGENLYRETPASGAPQTGAPGDTSIGTVLQCYLESSNVNVVNELVTMIQTQRAYEMNSKAISTSDQMLGRLVQI